MLFLRHPRETWHLHLATVVLAVIGIQPRLLVDAFVQERAALVGTVLPVFGAAVVGPSCPHFVEGRDVVAGVGEALTETIGSKGDEARVGVDEEDFSR